MFGEFAGPVAKVLISLGKKTLDEIKDSRKQVEISQSVQRYPEKFRKYWGKIKILPGMMDEAVSLETIYTHVQFLKGWGSYGFEGINDLEKNIDKSQRLRGFKLRDISVRSGIEVANQYERLAVLGCPGSGKSTFLKKLGFEELDKSEYLIPVFLELKDFQLEKTIDLEKYISKKLAEFGIAYPNEFVKYTLKMGGFLLLLDGLDEVPEIRLSLIVKHIQEFSNQYDKNKFVLSCRTAAYRHVFRGFKDVVIADFDDNKIESFINNWFYEDIDVRHETARTFWNYLQQPQNIAIKELARTPLMLTFLCLAYRKNQSIPPNRSQLYEKALNIFLEDWPTEKRLRSPVILKRLNAELEKVMLSEIAYDSFKENKLLFSKQELTNRIAGFVSETLDAPKSLDAGVILDAIVSYQGILAEPSHNIYSFSHLTFQEYIAARYIYQRSHDLEKLIESHICEAHWREFFLLVSGLPDNSDYFILKLEEQTAKYKSIDLVRNLAWLATNLARASSRKSYNDSHKRIIFFILISSLSIARGLITSKAKERDELLDFGNSNEDASELELTLTLLLGFAQKKALYIDNDSNVDEELKKVLSLIARVSLDLSGPDSYQNSVLDSELLVDVLGNAKLISKHVQEKLGKSFQKLESRMPKIQARIEERQSFVRLFQEVWFRGLGVQSKLVIDNHININQLCRYININLLLFECRVSAIRVSTKTWREVENRIFHV